MKVLLKKIASKARKFILAEHKQKLETLLLLQGKQLSLENTRLLQSLRSSNGLINGGGINTFI
ncbi:MAG: hypothetical protein MR629_03000 [Helicobacter sp.]|nr:hypothetical protein [Helicobacter sp.]